MAQLEKINLVMKLKRKISLRYLNSLRKNTDLVYYIKTNFKYNCWMNILTINKKNLNVRKLINYGKNGVDVRLHGNLIIYKEI